MSTEFVRVSPDCPSDLALDRLVAGELSFEAKRALESHLNACEHCKAVLRERQRGFQAFPELDSRAVLQRIVAQEQVAPRAAARGWRWKALMSGFGGLAVAAAAVLALWRPVAVPGDGESALVQTTRLKGGLKLRIFRARDGHSEEASSGSRFQAGDRLRFSISTPGSGFVSVVGIEADGKRYTAWPLDGSSAKQMPKLQDELLEGAVELDASAGHESLWLVHCPSPEHCVSRGPDASPTCAEGCTTSGFRLEKAR
ncbi:MAG: zf-HC2 domain-containing protein [Myxococcales bacterium]